MDNFIKTLTENFEIVVQSYYQIQKSSISQNIDTIALIDSLSITNQLDFEKETLQILKTIDFETKINCNEFLKKWTKAIYDQEKEEEEHKYDIHLLKALSMAMCSNEKMSETNIDFTISTHFSKYLFFFEKTDIEFFLHHFIDFFTQKKTNYYFLFLRDLMLKIDEEK